MNSACQIEARKRNFEFESAKSKAVLRIRGNQNQTLGYTAQLNMKFSDFLEIFDLAQKNSKKSADFIVL